MIQKINAHGYGHTRLNAPDLVRSRSISEVKQLQAQLVLGWVPAWEH